MQPLSPEFEPNFSPFSTAAPASRPPRIRLQALLFVLTCCTTFAAGVAGWQPLLLGVDDEVSLQIAAHWQRGLAYMAAVMAVLGCTRRGISSQPGSIVSRPRCRFSFPCPCCSPARWAR
ncbi:MAG: hypothetical protein WCQ77_16495 [Planctomycetota bacterium]